LGLLRAWQNSWVECIEAFLLLIIVFQAFSTIFNPFLPRLGIKMGLSREIPSTKPAARLHRPA